MNDQGTFIAALLDSTRRAFAAGTALRVSESSSEAAEALNQLGFTEFVSDAEIRLRNLAEALACGRPEVLQMDVEWLASTLASRQSSTELLRATLSCLRDELNDSLPVDAKPMAAEYLGLALQTLETPIAAPESCLAYDDPYGKLAKEFLVAVLEGKRASAERLIWDAVDGGAPVTDLHSHVVTQVQMELGRMWQIGESYVAEEHFGSRVVEDVLAMLRSRMVREPENGHTVVLASVSGNLHDIGPRLVADQFEMKGWQTIFLGANMPIEDLVRGVNDFSPSMVALSVGQALNLRSAADTIAALRASQPGLPVLVGGLPFSAIDGLWKDVGADTFAIDAETAVAFGESLIAAK
jgi:methanogenic corrinoid protein MtbC1